MERKLLAVGEVKLIEASPVERFIVQLEEGSSNKRKKREANLGKEFRDD